VQSVWKITAVVHALTGAVWLGAMAYSFFVLHPRARAYFQKPTDFESFIATISHGARWKVLAALGLLAGTGIVLTGARWPTVFSAGWIVLIGLKAGLLLAASALFAYTSRRLWPARVLATPGEIPQFQRAFRRVALAMIGMAAAALALGVLAHP
jgi:uncharacterized membrane protein